MSDEYIRKADIINIPLPDKSERNYITYNHDDTYEQGYQEALDKAASLPYADVVPVSAYKQVMWERDTAVEQLKQIGKGLGEVMDEVVSVVRCKDCRNCSYDSLFDHYWCNHTLGTRRVKPNDFCSYGERREE